MNTAPDMEPSLDDAIRAVHALNTPFNSHRVGDIETIRRFLLEMDYVPQAAPVYSMNELAALEAAYQAGFRMANHIGSVMVVRTEDLLKVLMPGDYLKENS